MTYELTIALRYLWTARKQLHTAFLSIISALGLAVGVATLLISLALLSGLQSRIKSRLISSSPHGLQHGRHARRALRLRLRVDLERAKRDRTARARSLDRPVRRDDGRDAQPKPSRRQ